jgi:hypothetical protein
MLSINKKLDPHGHLIGGVRGGKRELKHTAITITDDFTAKGNLARMVETSDVTPGTTQSWRTTLQAFLGQASLIKLQPSFRGFLFWGRKSTR